MNEKEELLEIIKKEIISTQLEILLLEGRTEAIAPDDSIGRITRMDAINNKSVADFSLTMSREMLNGLEFRQSKYGTDKFTKCVRCNAEIPIKRLMFMPHSLTCVACSPS